MLADADSLALEYPDKAPSNDVEFLPTTAHNTSFEPLSVDKEGGSIAPDDPCAVVGVNVDTTPPNANEPPLEFTAMSVVSDHVPPDDEDVAVHVATASFRAPPARTDVNSVNPEGHVIVTFPLALNTRTTKSPTAIVGLLTVCEVVTEPDNAGTAIELITG
jgi:hypothetical protein